MAIQLEPAPSGDVLYYRFSGRIMAVDMLAVRYAEDRYFSSLPEGCCLNIIADFSGIDSIAPHLFPDLQRMRMVTDRRVCVVVVAGANSYLRALAISLGVVTASPHAFIFSDTLADAHSLLTVGIS